MISDEDLKRLTEAFPHSFINTNLEFITNEKTNSYIALEGKNLPEVKVSLIEYLSRDACKTMWFRSDKANEIWQDYNREGINKFLGTEYTREDMEFLYQTFGNGVRHNLVTAFVNNGCDINWLKQALERVQEAIEREAHSNGKEAKYGKVDRD